MVRAVYNNPISGFRFGSVSRKTERLTRPYWLDQIKIDGHVDAPAFREIFCDVPRTALTYERWSRGEVPLSRTPSNLYGFGGPATIYRIVYCHARRIRVITIRGIPYTGCTEDYTSALCPWTTRPEKVTSPRRLSRASRLAALYTVYCGKIFSEWTPISWRIFITR